MALQHWTDTERARLLAEAEKRFAEAAPRHRNHALMRRMCGPDPEPQNLARGVTPFMWIFAALTIIGLAIEWSTWL